MREIAHRGFAGVAPENTVAAVRAACGRGVDDSGGADAVEVDVQPRADGRPVVFHDHRLDDEGESRGVTDAPGFVWEADAETLADANVLGSGEGMPTLDAVADVVPANVAFHVELKTPGSEDARLGLPGPGVAAWRPFVERVHDVLAAHDVPVVYSSFFDGALDAAREVASGTPRAALCLDPDRGLTRASEFDCRALHPSLDAVDDELVSRAHDRGLTVNAWTVQNWQQAANCRDAGVDGVIADYPGLLDHWQ
jgi:glycerophosphoryl diester phosphodiesterase